LGVAKDMLVKKRKLIKVRFNTAFEKIKIMLNFFKKLNPLLAYHNLIQGQKTRYPTILLTALYLFSPLDISPDLIPIIGWVDDGLLLIIFLIEIGILIFSKPKTIQSSKKENLTNQDSSSAKNSTNTSNSNSSSKANPSASQFRQNNFQGVFQRNTQGNQFYQQNPNPRVIDAEPIDSFQDRK
jgi:uncharacterized membrane protein YkvA (DUF1232 family)